MSKPAREFIWRRVGTYDGPSPAETDSIRFCKKIVHRCPQQSQLVENISLVYHHGQDSGYHSLTRMCCLMIRRQAGHDSLTVASCGNPERANQRQGKGSCKSVSLAGLTPSNCQWIAVESGDNCFLNGSGRKWSYPWFGAQKSYLPQSADFSILVVFRYPLGLRDPTI